MVKESIKSWPEEDCPREKLFKYGEHKLSDSGLLAILLRIGKKGESAIDLASKIMQVKVLDHIIIGDNKHYSFADKGLIEGYNLNFKSPERK